MYVSYIGSQIDKPLQQINLPVEIDSVLNVAVDKTLRRGRVSLRRLRDDSGIRKWLREHSSHGTPLTPEDVLRCCPNLQLLETKHMKSDSIDADVVFVWKDCAESANTSKSFITSKSGDIDDQIPFELTILLMNERLVIINKTAGVKMEALVEHCGNVIPSMDEPDGMGLKDGYVINSVSRLDQGTSGAVVIPRSYREEKFLTEQFKNRRVQKWYVCITTGLTEMKRSGEVDVRLRHAGGDTLKTFAHPKGKPSCTRYYVVCSTAVHHGDDVAYYHVVLCQPVTGRTHQIRAHMAHIGYPLIGDSKYAGNLFKKSIYRVDSSLRAERALLHSYRVILHDSDGNLLTATAPLQDDFYALYEKLFLDNKISMASVDTRTTKQCRLESMIEFAMNS